MIPRAIVIKGARQHNLKNIDVSIPRGALTVITGPSGSGKSSLAFDTLYAEAQRRYVESLSSYARQFLGILDKPDCDSIEGLGPAIAIEQKRIGHNPRSTVGTITELHDYLRLLFARVGTPTCYRCAKTISRHTVQDITDTLLQLPDKTRYQLLAPVIAGRRGGHRDTLARLRKDGFTRVIIDGTAHSLDEDIDLDKRREHCIEAVVDRLVAGTAVKNRITDSVETALRLSGNGLLLVDRADAARLRFSNRFACPDCNVTVEELTPRMFSFNSPFGACETCSGLGCLMELDEELLIPDPSLSLDQGAVAPWSAATTEGSWNQQILASLCRHYAIARNRPFAKLTKKQRDIILHGSGDEKIPIVWNNRAKLGSGRVDRPFEGVIPSLLRRYTQSNSEEIRRWIEGFMSRKRCPDCGGTRLKRESRAVLVAQKSITDLSALSLHGLRDFLDSLTLSQRDEYIARQLLRELRERTAFLVDVGVGYLTLDRASSSLSGGEAQRIQLATQIGSRLTGVIYILDEPSIGLHARDNARLLATLTALRDLGNTVVVVEHDRETMLAADHLIDIGPGAGAGGGTIVASGTPAQVAATPESLTGAYLSGARAISVPASRGAGTGELVLQGACGHNLKDVQLVIALGTLTCVSGVSGSGKSSLINQTLYPMLARRLHRAKTVALPCRALHGVEAIDKVIDIDQSPIGRTPRSNPATYTKTFDAIRDLFAMLAESKLRGYGAGRFSFNTKGGRCESCEGDGVTKIEMHFLPDVFVQCEACRGKRYNRETLEVTYKGKNIAEVLDMSVDEALAFFTGIPAIKNRLSMLSRVGLGYLHLGQQATTLSGGEAQRIKLAAELARRATGRTLYILDEPTTGLHFEDTQLLIHVLRELVARGNTVIIIEHNLDVITCADQVIDLGPEGGDGGGRIVATGTPEQLARDTRSITGQYLRKHRENSPGRGRSTAPGR